MDDSEAFLSIQRIAIALLLALIPALIAKRKGRRFGVWYVYGLFLFIVAIIHVSFARRLELEESDDHALFEQAQEMHKSSLKIWEKKLGSDHPDVATILNDLAVLYQKHGQNSDAESHYKRALAIRERALGLDHPDTVNCRASLLTLGTSSSKSAARETDLIQLPTWLIPQDVASWPVQTVADARLGYSLPIRERWTSKPAVTETSMEVVHHYDGLVPGEFLTINFMPRAEPFGISTAGKMRMWVDTALLLTGYPHPILEKLCPDKSCLLEWGHAGSFPDMAGSLEVDEVEAYTGVARVGGPAGLVRIYTLLARRHTVAWKISLSFMTACIPGAWEELVDSNDHVRAGATFGRLKLQMPASSEFLRES